MVDIFKKLEDLADDPLGLGSQVQDENRGFPLSSNIPADGNGLPTSKYRDKYNGKIRRNIIKWFVPEFGVVSMYINPNNITYTYNKQISSERTKGGYSLQYWGEDLIKISLSGTTGSSGIEGINLLQEIYRAEQFAIDGAALKVEAGNNNAENLAASAIEGAFGKLGNKVGGIAGSIIGGIGDAITSQESIIPRINPSLAQYAFTVEMYYGGVVYRGYFNSFRVTESANNFAFDYSLEFVATQQRGYRANYLPFHKNPYYSPTDYAYSENNVPIDYSYNKKLRDI